MRKVKLAGSTWDHDGCSAWNWKLSSGKEQICSIRCLRSVIMWSTVESLGWLPVKATE